MRAVRLLFTDTTLLVAFLNAFCFEVYCSLLPCAMNQFPPFGLSPKGLQLLKRIWRSHQIYPAVSRVIRSAFALLPIKRQI